MNELVQDLLMFSMVLSLVRDSKKSKRLDILRLFIAIGLLIVAICNFGKVWKKKKALKKCK